MQTIQELHAHYMAVRARLNAGPPKVEKKLTPMLVETQPYASPIMVFEPQPEPVQLTPSQQILKDVAEKHKMTVFDVKGPCRQMKYVKARQEAVYRMSTELKFSLMQIGRQLGFRDHTTILNSLQRYKKRNGLD
jgi:hypothetical protein